MGKKVMVVCGIISGVIVALGITGFIVLARGDNPAFAVMLRRDPYEKGYRCIGTGDVSFSLDINKLRQIPGFPEGEAGELLTDIVSNNISSMSVKIDYHGAGKGGESLSALKLASEGFPGYESMYYTDGVKKWINIFEEGREGKWIELLPSAAVESIASSLDMERLGEYKDYFALTAQDESSSTFLIKLTGETLEPLFGEEGKKSIEALAGDVSLDEFLNTIDLGLEMRTANKVNFFTPYVGLSTVNLTFTLPFEKVSGFVGGSEMNMLDPEEMGIFKSVYVNVKFNMEFTYGDTSIERPQILG